MPSTVAPQKYDFSKIIHVFVDSHFREVQFVEGEPTEEDKQQDLPTAEDKETREGGQTDNGTQIPPDDQKDIQEAQSDPQNNQLESQDKAQQPLQSPTRLRSDTAISGRPYGTLKSSNPVGVTDAEKYKCRFEAKEFLSITVHIFCTSFVLPFKEKSFGKFRPRESIKVKSHTDYYKSSDEEEDSEKEEEEEILRETQEKHEEIFFAPFLLPTGVIGEYGNEHKEVNVAHVIQLESLPLEFFNEVLIFFNFSAYCVFFFKKNSLNFQLLLRTMLSLGSLERLTLSPPPFSASCYEVDSTAFEDIAWTPERKEKSSFAAAAVERLRKTTRGDHREKEIKSEPKDEKEEEKQPEIVPEKPKPRVRILSKLGCQSRVFFFRF